MKVAPIPIWVVRVGFFSIAVRMVVFWMAHHDSALLGGVIFVGGALIICSAGLVSFLRSKVALWYVAIMVVAVPLGWILGVDVFVFYHQNSFIDYLLQVLIVMTMPCASSYWLLTNSEIRDFYH